MARAPSDAVTPDPIRGRKINRQPKMPDRKLNLTVGKIKAAIPLFLLCSQKVMFASHEEK
jgi:hypothetical protein